MTRPRSTPSSAHACDASARCSRPGFTIGIASGAAAASSGDGKLIRWLGRPCRMGISEHLPTHT